MFKKRKAFTLAEVLLSFTIVAIIASISVPFLKLQSLMNEYEPIVVQCLRVDGGAGTSCDNTFKYLKSKKGKTYETLLYFANNETSDEKNWSRTIFKSACDAGHRHACDFFVNSCSKSVDNSDCYWGGRTPDLAYYLATEVGKFGIAELKVLKEARYYYNANNPKINQAVVSLLLV